MRILYITSGVKQLYPHRLIDHSIETALNSLMDETQVYHIDSSKSWDNELVALVQNYEPDYVFTIHGGVLTQELVQRLKSLGTIMGIWFIDDPYDIDESVGKLHDYDLVFTNEESCVSVYQGYGYRAYYLSLGTLPEFYYPEIVEGIYQSQVCIVGSPYPRRVEIVKYLLDNLPKDTLKIVGPYWYEYFPGRKELINRYVNYHEIRRFYNGAKINLNIYRNDDEHVIPNYQVNTEKIPANSPNNRTFDIGICKAFQLSDIRLGLGKIFDLETELITFENERDLLEKINYYLQNPDKCNQIAKKIYYKVIEKHCFRQRLLKMIGWAKEIIIEEVSKIVTPDVLQQGKIIKAKGPAVYFVYQNRKHLIPSEDVFDRLKLRWEDMQEVDDWALKSILKGLPLEIE